MDGLYSEAPEDPFNVDGTAFDFEFVVGLIVAVTILVVLLVLVLLVDLLISIDV
jgi:hypothetical protein